MTLAHCKLPKSCFGSPTSTCGRRLWFYNFPGGAGFMLEGSVMLKKFLIAIGAVILAFLGYVALQPAVGRVERSASIAAPVPGFLAPAKISINGRLGPHGRSSILPPRPRSRDRSRAKAPVSAGPV